MLRSLETSKKIRQRNLANVQQMRAKKFPKRSINLENLHVIHTFDSAGHMRPEGAKKGAARFGDDTFDGVPKSNPKKTEYGRKYTSVDKRMHRARKWKKYWEESEMKFWNQGYKRYPRTWYKRDPRHFRENFYEVVDIPLEEGDYEEVETTSPEGGEKAAEIPVGFRKYRLYRLRYKRKGFFQPKIYDVCRQRTVVNCLNLQADESVDVDILSEAEYEAEQEREEGTGSCGGSGPKKKVADKVKKDKVEELKQEMEEDANEKEEVVTKEDEEEDIEQEEEEEYTEQQFEEDDAEQHYEEEDGEQQFEEEDAELEEAGEDAKKEAETESTKKDDKVKASKKTRPLKTKTNAKELTVPRAYHKLLADADSSPDLYQGVSVVQHELNNWNSHLIGLEYLLEIRRVKGGVERYHCLLCEQRLPTRAAKHLIRHLINTKHVARYLGSKAQPSRSKAQPS